MYKVHKILAGDKHLKSYSLFMLFMNKSNRIKENVHFCQAWSYLNWSHLVCHLFFDLIILVFKSLVPLIIHQFFILSKWQWPQYFNIVYWEVPHFPMKSSFQPVVINSTGQSDNISFLEAKLSFIFWFEVIQGFA